MTADGEFLDVTYVLLSTLFRLDADDAEVGFLERTASPGVDLAYTPRSIGISGRGQFGDACCRNGVLGAFDNDVLLVQIGDRR